VDSPDADDDEKGASESIVRQCAQAAVRLADLDRLDNAEMVYFLDVNKTGPAAASAKLLEAGHVLRHELFGRLDSAILASATLTCAGSFAFVREQVGAPPEMLELSVDTPFNFGRQAILVLPDLPDPRAPEYPEAAVDVSRRVIEICDGRTLVLCTSYRSLEALHNRLRRDRAHRILRQGELPRTELAKIFREDEKSVLLGCESFWTGIDVPGPALTALVIDKLPFPNVQDPVVDAISDRNPAAFQEFMVPTAILMFRQGVGRLIRRADDVGAVVVLDCRLKTKGYGTRFLDSLPAMYQTANLEEISKFLAWSGRPVAVDALGEQSELWGAGPKATADMGPPPLLDDEIPF
jgi:ATP-dependent DNA helicase DinG